MHHVGKAGAPSNDLISLVMYTPVIGIYSFCSLKSCHLAVKIYKRIPDFPEELMFSLKVSASHWQQNFRSHTDISQGI